jgi:hypothetical protein
VPPFQRIRGLSADPAATRKVEKEMEDFYRTVIISAQHA